MRDAVSWWNQNGGKRSRLNAPPSSQDSESSSPSSKKGTWKSQCIPPGPPKMLFWCRDRLCSSLYPPFPSLAMWLVNYKKVCQLAQQGEGRKESKTSERISFSDFSRAAFTASWASRGVWFCLSRWAHTLICPNQMYKCRRGSSALTSTFCRSVDRLLCFYNGTTTDVLVYGPQLWGMLLLRDGLLTCVSATMLKLKKCFSSSLSPSFLALFFKSHSSIDDVRAANTAGSERLVMFECLKFPFKEDGSWFQEQGEGFGAAGLWAMRNGIPVKVY